MKSIYISLIIFVALTGFDVQAMPGKTNTLEITALNDDETKTDVVTVSYDANATTGFDNGLDVVKTGDTMQLAIYATTSNHSLSFNAVNTITETPEFPISFYPGTDGLFTFDFTGVSSFDPTVNISLEDKREHLFHNVRSGVFVFYSATTDARDRFVLHFTPAATITTVASTCSTAGNIFVEQKGAAVWNFILYGTNSNQIIAGVLDESAPLTVDVPGGIYTLSLRDDYNYQVVKTINVIKPDTLNANFNLSAETIQVGETLFLSAQTPNAGTHAWNFGDGNTGTGSTVSHSFTRAGTYNITYTASQTDKCDNTVQKTVTVADEATGVSESGESSNVIIIWSDKNDVLVDFSRMPDVKATISVVNLLGQELLNVHYEQNDLIRLPIKNISGSYVLVKVTNSGKSTLSKVWIK